MDSHIAKHLLLDSDVVNPYQITLNDVHASERFSVTTADIRYNVYIVFTASFDIRFSDSDKTPVNASGSLISDLNLRGPDVDCGSAVVYNDKHYTQKRTDSCQPYSYRLYVYTKLKLQPQTRRRFYNEENRWYEGTDYI
jgi:hypothetical protein